MTDLEILKQSLNGNHLSKSEVDRLEELVRKLNLDIKSRK